MTLSATVNQFKASKAIYFEGLPEKFDLKPTTTLVLIALCNHYNSEKSGMFPTQEYISKKMNISVKSVQRAIQELRQKGLLIYECNGSNLYKFTDIFFSSVNMSDPTSQKVSSGSVNLSPKHDNKYKNNRSEFKKSFEATTKSIEATREEMNQVLSIKPSSPLDMPKDEAIAWYNSLIPELRNSFFAKQIRKKWNLNC